jgi:hypothetical protein
MLERGGDGAAYLEERLRSRDYHEPTLREMLDRVGPLAASSPASSPSKPSSASSGR